MQAKIIFDVATKPFAWQPVWASAGAAIFGCLLILLKRFKSRYGSRIAGYFFILCALAGTGYSLSHWYLSRRNHLALLANGRYEIAEGKVENFRPMPDDGSLNESFSISGHSFSYSDHDDLEITDCFNQTALHRGPIHASMVLRLKFIDNCILQIEELPQESEAAGK
jgi:hypothetical protein